MELFPAVLIGGPPHSGKSVLAYSLRQALTTQGIDHYLLRAYPDGEGNWSNESPLALARQLRRKGEGSSEWVDAVCRDIDRRQLPFLVDVGGKPTPDQERIFSRCTHAVLLTRDADAPAKWQNYACEYSLTILAELNSTLNGTNTIHQNTPILRGEITNLHRHRTAHGESFDALLQRLIPLLHYPPQELRQIHLNAAPTDTVIDLDKLANTLNIGERWNPAHLQLLKDYLPAQRPLSIYGGKANWLYAALAQHSFPAPFFQFDPRMGWISPPKLHIGMPSDDSLLRVKRISQPDYQHFIFDIPSGYLNFYAAKDLPVPPLPPHQGLVIAGKLPHWLITALARRYASAPWLAIFQPQLQGAVVISTTNDSHKLGTVIAF